MRLAPTLPTPTTETRAGHGGESALYISVVRCGARRPASSDLLRSWALLRPGHRAARALVGHPREAEQSVGEQRIGRSLYPRGCRGAARPAGGRVVFDPAVLGRVVRGRDHDAVGEPPRPF